VKLLTRPRRVDPARGRHRVERSRSDRPTVVAPLVAALVSAALVGGVTATVALRDDGQPRAASTVPGPGAASLAGPPTSGSVVRRPQRISIPEVGVESGLVDLAIDPRGELAPPPSFDVAGWFAGGIVPGDRGPALIAGHVDSRVGPGVFFRLSEVATGDEIRVALSDGTITSFRVTSVARFAKDEFPTAQVYGPSPVPQLNLVTCGGDFDSSERRYADNVVVEAVRA
jgi:hypothetical protein